MRRRRALREAVLDGIVAFPLQRHRRPAAVLSIDSRQKFPILGQNLGQGMWSVSLSEYPCRAGLHSEQKIPIPPPAGGAE